MNEEVEKIMNDVQSLLNNCKHIQEETNEMNHGIEFLQNEYRTNKHYFCEEGKPTIDDVIKTVFEFAWGAHRNYTENKK